MIISFDSLSHAHVGMHRQDVLINELVCNSFVGSTKDFVAHENVVLVLIVQNCISADILFGVVIIARFIYS